MSMTDANTRRGPDHGSIVAASRAVRPVQLRLLGPHRPARLLPAIAAPGERRPPLPRRRGRTPDHACRVGAANGELPRVAGELCGAARGAHPDGAEGARKEEFVAPYYGAFKGEKGVVVILKSMEQSSTFISYEPRHAPPSGDDYRIIRRATKRFSSTTTSTSSIRSWGR